MPYLYLYSLIKENTMKKHLLFCIAILSLNLAYAQNTSKTVSKKDRKELLKVRENEKLKIIHELVESKLWILKPTSIQTLAGENIPLATDENFIICEKDIATFQFPAPEFIRTGETEFVGISSDGDISAYSVDEFKENKSVKCIIQVISTPFAWVKLAIEINSDGIATVHYMQSDGVNFTFSGTIESQD
jgi:hypothetical protein